MNEHKILRTSAVSLLCSALILLLVTFVLDYPAAAKWIGVAWVLTTSWIVYFVYRRCP